MIAYRQFAPTNICRSTLLVSALAWTVFAASAASADDGWQASAGSSSREAPADWAPDRNQLRESASAASASQDSSQTGAATNANAAKQSARSNEPTADSRQNPTAKSKVAANNTQPEATASRWMLPNQQASTTTNNSAANFNNQSPREPRPFVPASNNARQLSANTQANQPVNQQVSPAAFSPRMPMSAAPPAMQQPHAGPALAHQVTTINPNAQSVQQQSAQQRYAARSNPPSPVGYPGSNMPPSRNVNAYAQQPMQQSHSYSGRLWNAVNVAFQSPGEWGEGVAPEQIPMPAGGYSMGGDYAPHMMSAGGCCNGACGCGESGCGDGCGCGCGGSCGDSCGSGVCGCADGCGCGGDCEPGCGCEPSCGCGQCDKGCCLDDVCIGVGDDQSCHTIRVRLPKWQELSIFGGVHGFKGPYDQNRDSGNFGFQEGINAGFKVPFSGLGYQIGYQAVHSELNGDENTGIRDSFTQHFLTGGVFHRAQNGVQGGVAWDMLSDDRFGTHNFYQLRAEMSLINGGCHELGASITAHLNEHEFLQDEAPSIFYRATDQYLFFYRFHSPKGGEGRFYGGFTDDSDGIVGSDMLIPLSDRWSLATAFTYLIPDAPSGTEGSAQEAWNISTALVWSWDCRARRSHSNCYRPLFNVADNGSLIVNDHPGQAVQVSAGAP